MLSIIKKYDFNGVLIAKESDNIVTEGKSYPYKIIDDTYVVFYSDSNERKQMLYSFLRKTFYTSYLYSKKRSIMLKNLIE